MKTMYTSILGVKRGRWMLMGLVLAAVLFSPHQDATAAVQVPVTLGSADFFAVFSPNRIDSTNGGTITGDVGVSPGTAFVKGAPAVTVSGTVFLGDDPIAVQAKADLATAYDDAAGRTLGTMLGGELGGLTLVPGLYTSTVGSFAITSVDLTLDAQDDPNAVWIFQMPSSTLTVLSGRKVKLINGARAGNIFWQVGSSATLGTNADFKGTILAAAAITLNTGAKLEGRALALGAAVTLDNNTLTLPVIPSDTYTIRASADVHGEISPSGIVAVNSGSNQTFTITPAANYYVADVLVDGVSVGAVTSYTFTNVTRAHTIAVSFTNTPTIVALAGANGAISPSGIVAVNSGSNQTFTIIPAANYSVADVLVDGVSVGAATSYTFTNVTTSHTILASFKKISMADVCTSHYRGEEELGVLAFVRPESPRSEPINVSPIRCMTMRQASVR